MFWLLVAMVIAAVLAISTVVYRGRERRMGSKKPIPTRALEALEQAYGERLTSEAFAKLTEAELSELIRAYLARSGQSGNPQDTERQIFEFLSAKQREISAAISHQRALARRLITASGHELESELAKQNISDETKQRVRELERMKGDLVPKLALTAIAQMYGKDLSDQGFASLTDEQLRTAIEVHMRSEKQTRPDMDDVIAADLGQRMFVVLADMRARVEQPTLHSVGSGEGFG